jgi:hypothetical protein
MDYFDPSSPKSSPDSVMINDIVINTQDPSDVWGVVLRVEPASLGMKRVIFLSGGRIAKFSTYGEKWHAYSPHAYAAFVSKPDNLQARMWREIEQANAEDEALVARHVFPSEGMRLFLLKLHKDAEVEPTDDYDFGIVRSMVVAAYTAQSAKEFVVSPDSFKKSGIAFSGHHCHDEPLEHCHSAWEESRNILCKTIGLSFGLGTKTTIVNVSWEDHNG